MSKNSRFFLILYWFFTVILKNIMHFYKLDPIKNHHQSLRSKHSLNTFFLCIHIQKNVNHCKKKNTFIDLLKMYNKGNNKGTI